VFNDADETPGVAAVVAVAVAVGDPGALAMLAAPGRGAWAVDARGASTVVLITGVSAAGTSVGALAVVQPASRVKARASERREMVGRMLRRTRGEPCDVTNGITC
jgi:hypothetical protein